MNALCPQCGGEIEAGQSCPRCLLKLGVAGTGDGEAPTETSQARTRRNRDRG